MIFKKALMSAALAAVAAFAFAPSANAAFGDFTFSTSLISPSPSTVDGTPPGIATLAFAPQSPTGGRIGSGLGTDITPLILTLTGNSAGTATFKIPIDFILSIKDVASGGIQKVEYKATLTGSVTVGNTSASNLVLSGATLTTVSNTIPNGVSYEVTANAFLPPGPVPVGGSSTGGIGLHVRAVPEPASMALLGMGALGGLGLIRRRKATV